ncbi:mitochondrial import receptor subunit TOM40 homolog 1 [Drosophila teissieri]|uniref:mitochondrial import receptor subunit TOM40 homolog 1 n=1 Tax=Drosophila teissieri TaxID=7243 RepID=UPI001CBA4D85|nr:mitochondrial import receptor subunit TOM40 homolog 1 [Drosophila teissieri]XP_043657683.1 mitochondrial import receptor subunit TOM40 homolog 1 [Drosophila teissieri]
MGNVLAASSGAPASGASNLGLGLPEPAPVPSDSGSPSGSSSSAGGSDSLAAAKDAPLENPGTVEELHKKCKDIQAITFEGAKIMLNKGLSNHFQVSHTINMSNVVPSGYRFGATYVGTKQYSPTEAFPVLLGDIDPSGNLNANVIHQFSARLRCKFASQIQDSKMVATQLTTDYRGNDYTASLTVANPSIFTNSGVVVGQYLQSVTPALALGAELAYQFGPNVPGRQIAIVSAVGRYTAGNSVWSGTLGQSGLHVCYYQKASDQLQIGAEVETSLRMQESVATLAYQIDLPKADLVFRGGIDSNWQIFGVLEKRLAPLPFTLALSGRMNHVKNNFRLGCGLMIG